MNYRTELHLSDLDDISQFGLYLNKPSNQLVRLISLFNEKQRVLFAKEAHCFFEGKNPESSLKQFAAKFILDEFIDESDMPFKDLKFLCGLSERLMFEGAHIIPVAKLPVSLRSRLSGVASGKNYRDISLILANTLLMHDMTRNEELTQLLARTIKQTLLTAEQAAAVASVIEFNDQDIQRFEWKAGCLVDETRIFPEKCFSSVDEKRIVFEKADTLDWIIKEGKIYRDVTLQEQRALATIDELCHDFRLAPSPTGIFIPLRNHILVARTIAEAEQLAHNQRDIVFAMSPREFEVFMTNIFCDLGFDVELTKTTRDGGADLICMRSLHGIPIRLAVEIKRYRDKPIDVRLVRSFVGANERWHANRLIYVTTSRYTKSAYDFADNYASHILTLKDYDQIIEWCKYVQQQSKHVL